MKTIIEYTTYNKLKGNRIQTYLKEVANLALYKELESAGVIWGLKVIELN